MSDSSHRYTTSHHVVILGGGITGLSAAFHLARKHPTVQITLIEKTTRFGGWVRSERVEVRDSDGNRGSVVLEAGPRTIRPNSKSILELVRPSYFIIQYLHI
jgi:protoporphyrinogen/coproporphyrinogen III oxidase